MTGTVFIVGAGPGNPDLITVKGMRLLEEAEVLIYAGSLINPALVARSPAAEKYDSWGMKLEEMVAIMVDAAKAGKKIVRLHSGDPALYGAIVEQVALLKKAGVTVERVPGVSSMFAAAAALGTQYTLRGVSESLLVTRPSGKTLEIDQIRELSRLGATLVIFLGTEHLETIMDEVECPPDTPAAVVYKASWEDEMVVTGTVADIAAKARAAGIEKTALIIIGEVVRATDASFEHSHLYG